MARLLNRLAPKAVATIQKPGRHADGGGLYLNVGAGGARSWVFLFRWHGKLKEMGLGSANAVTLARARQLAADARAAVADGRNPIEARKADRAIPTFGEFSDALVEALEGEWRNEKHRAQWRASLKNEAAPLRELRLDRIETADVHSTLKTIWTEKPETASRLRGRIERVLDAAKARGYRSGENPARWRGHLSAMLPKRQKLTRGHHAALAYGEVGAFVQELRKREAIAALALEFLILTAVRSGEVRHATWSEFDLASAVWTIPATRMKAGREHRVPLIGRALEILEQVRPLAQGKADAVVFPATTGKPLSDAAFSALLKRMDRSGAFTPHGFRSSFRDWAGEVSTFPRDLAEQALAHRVGDSTELAYRRGDALEKRRKMMEAWAVYCEPKEESSVVNFGRA